MIPADAPSPSPPRTPVASTRWGRLRRGAVLIFCAGYLLTTGYFSVRHLLGDSLSHPLSYFFTWDMFPGYATESTRRLIIGFTGKSERMVQLLPATWERYRWGMDGSVTRLDLYDRAAVLRPYVQKLIRRYNAQHPADPVVTVLVVQQYWPSKFNLPDDLYRKVYGKENPHRKYWRIVERVEVDEGGHLKPQTPE